MAVSQIEIDSIRQTVADILPEIVALRHELHQHPEIRFEEEWTSDRIARFLDEVGIAYTRGHAKGTGIVATLEGSPGKTVVLRADMDALEIAEETGLSYASTIPERMHACGHDGHMANLCGAVKTLSEHRGLVKGCIKFFFQPAEENAAGGRYMVEEGLLDGVDAAFGLHGWPTLRTGVVGVKTGAAMASADFFRITIEGAGTHAADPGSGVDPIAIAGHVMTALQNIVSREINPWEPAVITVTKIYGGHALNVIPEKAYMEGTFRALSEKVRKQIFEAIPRLVEHTAAAHRARATADFIGESYPFLSNDPKMSELAKRVVVEAFGRESLNEPANATMGSEDFAFYLQKVPGAYVFLGVNPSDSERYPSLHSPRYDFNDDALPVGIELMCRLALRFLEGGLEHFK